ncbi:MAG: chorismate lyase [Pseudomonadales bacterium]|nr:chorismate lyase [Pseudomonadales bacterium]
MQTIWHSFHRSPAFYSKRLMNRRLCNWLLDRGSLTRRLIEAGEGDFRVEILRQGVGTPRCDESRALGLCSRQRALIREVLLYVKGEPWVYARSVIPCQSLQGPLAYLKKLDNRPLGALLFRDPGMRRSPIEIGRLPASRVPLAVSGPRWGRRSVFWLKGKPLLVSETFLYDF